MRVTMPGGVDPAVLPDDDAVEAYRRRGWHVTPPVIPDDVLDAARAAIDHHQRGDRDRGRATAARFADWHPDDGAGVRNSEFISVQCPAIAVLTRHPAVAAIAGRLAGAREIRLFDDQAVHKPAGQPSTEVGWHTDHAYWSTCTSDRMLTAWIPLADADATGGALMVISGSHLWDDLDLRGFNDRDLAAPRGAEITTLELERGQMSFHHMRTLHASGANLGTTDRYALAVHLQDETNHHRAARTVDGDEIVLPHDRLCRTRPDGAPDYSDPDVFPALWTSP